MPHILKTIEQRQVWHLCHLGKKGDVPRDIGKTSGGLTSKLRAVTDGSGRPIILRLTAGQVSDYYGARMALYALPSNNAGRQ